MNARQLVARSESGGVQKHDGGREALRCLLPSPFRFPNSLTFAMVRVLIDDCI